MTQTESTTATSGRPSPPAPSEHVNHWDWRPEWGGRRNCWYWYLTFAPRMIEQVVPQRDLDLVRATPWLDAVPSQWLHLTVSEVGFADELDEAALTAIRDGVAGLTDEECRPRLQLGPVQAMRTAVVLSADGGEGLHRLQQRVREATAQVLDTDASLFHPHAFWPHVSLGYVNRPVPKDQVADLLGDMEPVSAAVRPAGLALVAVTRQGGHYRWTSRAA